MVARALFPVLALLSTSWPTAASTASPEGRWRSEHPALVLDIAACAAGWCGIAVDGAGQCGAQVLQFAALAPWGFEDPPAGRLDLPGRPGLLPRVTLDTPAAREPGPMLSIVAVDAPAPGAFLRRIFPFQARMARLGPPRCQAPATS